MILSILVCSVTNRFNTFLPNIMNKLNSQAENFEDVEVICLMDNKKMMLGDKRNQMVNLACGKYVVFIDDDDDISDDYIEQLYLAIDSGADIINFTVNVSLNGGEYKPCYYNKDYEKDYNKEIQNDNGIEIESYHRLPNHIMCVKRELALSTKYPSILRGEDASYSKELKPKLQSQFNIDKVLYYYNFNQATTETQKYIKRK